MMVGVIGMGSNIARGLDVFRTTSKTVSQRYAASIAESWDYYRKRLGTPKARRASLPPPPSWQTLQPLRRRTTVEVGGTAGDRASEYPVTDAMAQRCVDARAEYIDRLGAGMHRHRIPITEESANDVVAHMNDADFTPAAYAYAKMCDRISNAWRGSRE
jgi:hypothetical protein